MPNNNTTVTVTNSADKQTFAVKNPKSGKIIAFINFGNEVDAPTANGLSEADMADIIAKCDVVKFTKSTKGSALEGLL